MRYPTVTIAGATYAIVPVADAARAGLTDDPATRRRQRTARRLRRARVDAELTQAELAERLGCGQAYVSSVEIGRDPVSTEREADWLAACKRAR